MNLGSELNDGRRGEDYRREVKGERESKRENNRFLIELFECLDRRENRLI